ncbi:MAG: metallophosphoesterase, partial [Fulvivirga sp.]|nr:metallophosphoesterase [Fulvivirga sp.]
MNKLLTVIFLLSVLGLNAQEKPDYTVFLVGDGGKVSPDQIAVLDLLKDQLLEVGEKGAVVYLGDNIYPKGMPPVNSPGREDAEKYINSQINAVKHFEGRKFFIPGNHDWAQGRRIGFENLIRQEEFVESRLDSANVFLPSRGCPGPVEVSLNEEITLIILDTQWFLHNWDKPDEESGGCEYASELEILQALDQMIIRNAHKKVLVTSHHPMYTYGSHGGYSKTWSHFLPPVLGSIHPVFRKFIGSVQDNTHPRYRAMRNAMVEIFEKYPNLIHAAGHEHSLQYAYKDSIHYIVSGSAAKRTFVRLRGYAHFVESSNGFARLDYYSDGRVNLQLWKPKDLGDGGVMIFEKLLMTFPYVAPVTPEEFAGKVDLHDSLVEVAASNLYNATKFQQTLLGANYRDVWSTKIKVPLFDIGAEHGGLKIVQRGGGMQTKSLRLEAPDGKQYVLRSIEKYPENAVPEMLRNTFAVDLVQDQISAAHPYGAFVIPPMAEAVGIYHTNPQLVFIPDDPRFGVHRRDFANTLALYEERPAKDWSDADFFGNSPDIESTRKVLEELAEDNDNEVDQRFVLKSRLFDLIIGDWDRHDDQWRWSERDKSGKGKIYRPIPRDRDQAFFVNEGFFPEIWSRRWALPKFEGFDQEVDWTPGFMFNARYFDRSFLTDLSREEWLEVVEELQQKLTDEVIEAAIKQWPEEVYNQGGATIIDHIKAGRDQL